MIDQDWNQSSPPQHDWIFMHRSSALPRRARSTTTSNRLQQNNTLPKPCHLRPLRRLPYRLQHRLHHWSSLSPNAATPSPAAPSSFDPRLGAYKLTIDASRTFQAVISWDMTRACIKIALAAPFLHDLSTPILFLTITRLSTIQHGASWPSVNSNQR